MSKLKKLVDLYSTVKEQASEHEALLFTIGACLGTCIVAYEGYKFAKTVETAKAKAAELKKGVDAETQLSPEFKKQFRMEMAKIVGPGVAKLTLAIGGTCAMAVMSEKTNANTIEQLTHKVNGLATLYNASEVGQKIYEETVEEVVGKDKAGEIKQKSVTTQAQKEVPTDAQDTKHGEYLYKLKYTGTWFRSSYDHVNTAFVGLDMALNPGDYFDEDLPNVPFKIPDCTEGYFDVKDLTRRLGIFTDTGAETELIWTPGMNMSPIFEYGECEETHEPCCYISCDCPPTGKGTMTAMKSLLG